MHNFILYKYRLLKKLFFYRICLGISERVHNAKFYIALTGLKRKASYVKKLYLVKILYVLWVVFRTQLRAMFSFFL